MSKISAQSSEYVVFRLSNEIFAANIRIIKTVEKILPITRVPKTENYIAGVINLRGEIIPIMDLRKKFDMVNSENTDDSRIIVITLENMTVGIIVDSVEEVISIEYSLILNTGNIKSSINENFILGVARFDNKVVTILNFEQIVMIED